MKKIALLVSYARSEQKETSDIDFVIEKGKIKGYIHFCSFVNALEEKFDIHIDVMTYNSLGQSMLKETR